MSRRRWIGIGSLCLLFVLVAWASGTEAGRALDLRVVTLLRDSEGLLRGPTWWREFVRDLTALGGFGMVAATAVGVALWQLAAGRRRAAGRVVLLIGGTQLAVSLLKLAFARPRPTGVEAGQVVHTFSFPSGHAALSAAAFGGLAWALARRQPPGAGGRRALAIGFGVLVVLAVGFSRLGLGVHRPSEVLGGWCVAAAGLLLVVPGPRKR